VRPWETRGVIKHFGIMYDPKYGTLAVADISTNGTMVSIDTRGRAVAPHHAAHVARYDRGFPRIGRIAHPRAIDA